MIVLEQSASIERMHDPAVIMQDLELWARVAHKSEDKVTEGSAEKLLSSILNRTPPHESVIEHHNVTVRFVTCRGMTHELVRHRLASYTQTSTRYCDYSKDKFGNQIQVIRPVQFERMTTEFEVWCDAMIACERAYRKLIDMNIAPQFARGVLPLDLKTEIVMTANLREWRHVFRLRAHSAAHPQMQALMKDIHQQLHKTLPVIFPKTDD
jgi:thymidylate synthase (FAD)